MTSLASELSAALARNAETVCRHYLSAGRKAGRYWIVGDVQNTPGASMHVRLFGPERGQGAAGKWTDENTGEHGDLLDVIRHSCAFGSLAETLAEARSFLAYPRPAPEIPDLISPAAKSAAARRLFHMARPLPGTLAETYLRSRAITGPLDYSALRYHPTCYYRPEDGLLQTWPALIAAVTDLSGAITGVHRTWLAREGLSKAPIEEPRKALGPTRTHAVRLGTSRTVLLAGEGLETMLALRTLLPGMPAAAALSANHLALLVLPPGLERLYIAQDNDPAGRRAASQLAEIAEAASIEPRLLIPRFDDWNSDLLRHGFDEALAHLRRQIGNNDAQFFRHKSIALS